MGKELLSLHSIDEAMAVMKLIADNGIKANIWLGLLRNIDS